MNSFETVSIDDRKRKFLKESARIDRHNARFSWQLYLPDSSPSRSMGRCERGTHFSTHASLEFFSLPSMQKVSFSLYNHRCMI